MKKTPIRMQAVILISLISMISMVSFMKAPANAVNPPRISVINPQTGNETFIFYTNNASVGDKFNVTAWVYNVTDLFAYQVTLQYDPGPPLIFNATRAWLPDWDEQWVFYGKNAYSLPPTFKDSGGYWEVIIGSTLLGAETTFNGTGILAMIEFEILYAPQESEMVISDLAIDNADTYLLNSDVEKIPADKVDGHYNFIWLEPGLEVKPSKYVAVTELETFNISVWLNNVTSSDRLVGLEYKLRYNITLLNVTQVTEGLFLKQFGGTVFSHEKRDDYVKVNVTLTPSGGYPEGSGIIAIITFQSIYQDRKQNYSPLDFFDISLLDNNKNQVTPTTSPKNGLYTILPDGSSLITIDVHPTSIVIGSNATISGYVAANETKVGVNVTIYSRLVSEAWTNFTTVQTNSSGYYTYNWRPTNNGTFEFKANWTGDVPPPSYGAESDIATLTVKNLASAITIDVNPPIVTVGANVTISGALNVTRADVNVTIHFRLTGGTWSTLPTVQTNSSGNYTYVWTTTEGGTYELYADWLGDNETLGAESPKATLTVKKFPSSVTLEMDPFNTTVIVGSNITISGTIGAHETKNGVNVTIYYYQINISETRKISLATVTTDINGSYNYTWAATKRTTAENETFAFYAVWPGDKTTSGNYSFNAIWLTLFQKNSTITLDVNPETVLAGSSIAIGGYITPTKARTRVAIYYKLESGTWGILATVETNSNSIYNYTWTATKETLNPSETFELKASWSGDVTTKRAESNIRTVTVEKIQSTITINIDNSAITIGSNVTITGDLAPTRPNVNITIYYREKGTAVQSSLSAKTNSEGHYNYTWKPMKNATFELYAWWSGDENTYSHESDIVTLKVNLIKSSITISVYPETTTIGSNVSITGTIVPNKPGVEVSIWLKAADQSWIQLLGETTVDSNGNYAHTWTTTQVGTFELEARWPGDNFTEPAKSETKTVKIEEPFSLITYVPYILGGAAIIIIALGAVYLTKLKKR